MPNDMRTITRYPMSIHSDFIDNIESIHTLKFMIQRSSDPGLK